MIDLTIKGLPDHVIVAGKSFLLNTDFREWLKFSKEITKKDTDITNLICVVQNVTLLDFFQNQDEFINKLIEFYTNENSTPNMESNDRTKVIDYIQDGEYIVGSFMSAYGIDLTTCDMHWHMFLALFRCLPEDTKIKQIISMRSYRKDNTSYDTQCRKLKTAWALPQEIDAVDSEILDGINEEFYNC